MILAEEVQECDEEVLTSLIDIKYSTKLSEGKKGFQLAFCFKPNDFFEDEVHRPPTTRLLALLERTRPCCGCTPCLPVP